MRIKLISDSGAETDNKYLEKYPELDIVKMNVTFPNNENYTIGDISVDDYYAKLIKYTDELPKTAAASPGAFLEMFEKYLEDYDAILYIGLSSNLSGMFNSACVAKEMCEQKDKIYLFDSLAATIYQNIYIEEAISMIRKSLHIDEIIDKLSQLKGKITFGAMVQDLKYFVMGGRLSKTEGTLGSLLNIKPIVCINDEGKAYVGSKNRGVRKANMALLDGLFKKPIDFTKTTINIAYSTLTDEYKQFKELLMTNFPSAKIQEFRVGPIIGNYGGPTCYGISYIND